MTKKSIFVYHLFLSLNIPDFSLFFYKNCNPPLKKVTPSFPLPPSKNYSPVRPPLFENLVGGSTPLPPHPPQQKKEGVHTMYRHLSKRDTRTKSSKSD